jgi:hypothetical protein
MARKVGRPFPTEKQEAVVSLFCTPCGLWGICSVKDVTVAPDEHPAWKRGKTEIDWSQADLPLLIAVSRYPNHFRVADDTKVEIGLGSGVAQDAMYAGRRSTFVVRACVSRAALGPGLRVPLSRRRTSR